jgi:WD40 repeat protein
MARLWQSRSGTVERLRLTLLAISFAVLPVNAVFAQLPEHPMLVADPGLHTGVIRGAAVDEAGTLAVTGSEDKTVRIWSLPEGKLLQTIRMPAGPGNIGKVFAVAMNQNGDVIAVGGWTTDTKDEDSIYLFDLAGKLIASIGHLPDIVNKLVFSPDGRFLAAAVGGYGLRIFDRDVQWTEISSDPDYNTDYIYGITFASDGRLATASFDGRVRLYSDVFKHSDTFKPAVSPVAVLNGKRPYQIAFSPDGESLAVGFIDLPAVALLDGHNLQLLMLPNTESLEGNLPHVAWSRDGQILFAGGFVDDRERIFAWNDGGRGPRRGWLAGGDTMMSLHSLPTGAVLVTTADPLIMYLKSDGSISWTKRTPTGDLGLRGSKLAVSSDGMVVDFGSEHSKPLLRFDVRRLTLSMHPPADLLTMLPKEDGLPVENWKNELAPTLDGKTIRLDMLEKSRSLAIDHENRKFVLGTTWSLRAFDASEQRLWRRDGPGAVWGVNITADGRIVVAVYDDGTIRWHRMDNGRELLALMVLPDRTNWVAWTPEGYYAAKTQALGVLRWHVNQGIDSAARTVLVSGISKLNRPDVIASVLQDFESAKALWRWDAPDVRREVQTVTGAAKAPGARLHVLAIGISKYGDKAKDLKLNFADKDAHDIASSLLDTQGGPYGGLLYAEVKPIYLPDDLAGKNQIMIALDSMRTNMSPDDFAIIMFAGHGTMVDGEFYLLPYDVDITRPVLLKSSAISAGDFQRAVTAVAARGQVLVMLDACHAGAFTGADTRSLPDADVLRGTVAANNSGNISVLTSSTATQLSLERDDWGHGAFSKVLLDGLSANSGIDTDRNGEISMGELTEFLGKNLSRLTLGAQTIGAAPRYVGGIFASGL